jgi:hypothetical protein
MPAHGPPKNEVVKRRDTIQVGDRHAEVCGDIVKTFVGHPASMSLHDPHRIDTYGVTLWVVRGFRINLADFISTQHRAASLSINIREHKIHRA